jgi:hypothetical protein
MIQMIAMYTCRNSEVGNIFSYVLKTVLFFCSEHKAVFARRSSQC